MVIVRVYRSFLSSVCFDINFAEESSNLKMKISGQELLFLILFLYILHFFETTLDNTLERKAEASRSEIKFQCSLTLHDELQ